MDQLVRDIKMENMAYAILASWEGGDDPRAGRSGNAFLRGQCELVVRCVEHSLKRGAVLPPIGDLTERFVRSAENEIVHMQELRRSLADSDLHIKLAGAWDHHLAEYAAYYAAQARANERAAEGGGGT